MNTAVLTARAISWNSGSEGMMISGMSWLIEWKYMLVKSEGARGNLGRSVFVLRSVKLAGTEAQAHTLDFLYTSSTKHPVPE